MTTSIVIPFLDGQRVIAKLLRGIPPETRVILVDDVSRIPLNLDQLGNRPNTVVHRLEQKGYFAGAVNAGIALAEEDNVLILNQDIWFEGDHWLRVLEESATRADIVGDGVFSHPAWPNGYVQGTFMWLSRKVIDAVGVLDAVRWPLWGGTCEYQTRACRAGFKAMPLRSIPGFNHMRGEHPFGFSIAKTLTQEPEKKSLLIRTPPLISVIVPCYNYGRYLQDCLRSLVGGETSLGKFAPQSLGGAFEVIIVDDASRDETQEVGKSLANAWQGIRYYRLRENSGTARTLNFGISKAYGQYITFLSADDMRESKSLEKLYDTAEANPHNFVYDDVTLFGQGKRNDLWQIAEYDFHKILQHNTIPAGILYPRKAWEEVGGYPGLMDDGREDWAFNIALGLRGWCGVHLSEAGYLYRRENQNRSLRNTSPEHNEYFLGKLRTVFPDAYKGRFPMACCGGGGGNNVQPQARVNGNRSMSMSVQLGSEGMVRLKYLGKKAGITTWVGPSTKATYRFGLTRPLGWVDQRDVGTREGPGLLSLRENGVWVFAVDTALSQPAVAVEEKPVPELGDGVTVITELASGVTELSDGEPEELEVSEPAYVKTTMRELVVSVPDPGGMTVAAIQELQLTSDQWARLAQFELAGKKRKTVLAWAEENTHNAVSA